MFYSVQLLAKKGPLGTVWIAGHLDKRLKRNQIYETNISSSVGEVSTRMHTYSVSIAFFSESQLTSCVCYRFDHQPRSSLGVKALGSAVARSGPDLLPQNQLPVLRLQ